MQTPISAAIDQTIDGLAVFLTSVRRHLHQNPEPSLEEFETTATLARHLAAEDIPYRVAPSGRGLLAGAIDEGAEPVVAFRGDIDALRLQEGNLGVPYRSVRDGVMHGCGHDAHAAMALGAAIALRRCRALLPGSFAWRAIFQPAEETSDGAVEMIEAGAMSGVSSILGLHVDPEVEVGRVAQRPGVLTADCRSIKVSIQGRGGHAARPHQSLDPIAAAAQFVTLVYQTVHRAVDVREPLVVTFASIHGGDTSNAIPERVEILGTIRSLSLGARERACAAIQAAGRGVSAVTGVEIDVAFPQSVPQVLNDPSVNAAITRAAVELLGMDSVQTIPHPSLGGEDFAAYLAYAPGAMFRLGVAGAPGWPTLHSPRFDIDERALAVGAKVLARAAVLLSPGDTDHA